MYFYNNKVTGHSVNFGLKLLYFFANLESNKKQTTFEVFEVLTRLSPSKSKLCTTHRLKHGKTVRYTQSQFLLGNMKNLSCLPETVLSGGSGLVLVLVGEGSREESEPSNRACSRGEAGASRGDNRFSKIILSIGDVGDRGLDIEFRDSWLSLLYSGFVEVLGPIFLEFPPSNLNFVGSL